MGHYHAHHPHSAHAHGGGRGHHHHPHDHHSHQAVPQGQGKAFGVAIALNALFVVGEFVCGFWANSTALMADAGHNLSDVLGLMLAWAATLLARRAPSSRYTYGWGSASILAALANAVLLLLACGAIILESVQRFSQPPQVQGLTVMVVAGIGLLINGVSAWFFMNKSHADLNMRAAYLHLMADAMVSLGVVLTGGAMLWTHWYWLDPVISLVIAGVIVVGTWRVLCESVQLALNAVPAHIDRATVEAYLRARPGVTNIHDLHIWGMSTTESALTVHLVVPQGYPGDVFVDEITHYLKNNFNIQHSTLQVEQGTTEHVCAL